MRAFLRVGLGVLVALAGVMTLASEGSEVAASKERLVGHPRPRFPLSVELRLARGGSVPSPVRKAVDDWNAVFVEALGMPAFRWAEAGRSADVTIEIVAGEGPRRMGETHLETGDRGVLDLPVRIKIRRAARAGPDQRGRRPVPGRRPRAGACAGIASSQRGGLAHVLRPGRAGRGQRRRRGG